MIIYGWNILSDVLNLAVEDAADGLRAQLRVIASTLVDALFPPRCPVCGGILPLEDVMICRKCAKALPYVRSPYCQKCGKPIDSYEKETVLTAGRCLTGMRRAGRRFSMRRERAGP